MPKPIEILRVITWLPPGGIERKILAVLPRLNPNRFRARVLCIRERGALAEAVEAAGIPVDLIAMRSRMDPRGIWRISRYLKQNQIDVVHAHMYRAAVPSVIASRLAGAACVSQVHNVGTWETPRQVWMDRRLCRWRRGMIAVSERVKRDVQETLRVPAGYVRVIHNGVDLSRFRPPENRADAKRRLKIAPDHEVVLMAARLVGQKNPLGFLEAARRLAPQFPRAIFAIAGAGPLEERLRKEADETGLGERFRLLGQCDDMAAVYQAADVFALPSFKEGFSNALIEAMACGLPAVASDVGGNAEAVEHERDGFLIPPGDGEALYKRLVKLLGDEALRHRMASAAARRAGEFGLDRMVEAVSEYYEELAQR